jgi:hypothetical protein
MSTQTFQPATRTELPMTTEAAVLHGALDLRIEQKPLPALGPSDVLVEMRSGGICGSDMHYYADGRNGTNVLHPTHGPRPRGRRRCHRCRRGSRHRRRHRRRD